MKKTLCLLLAAVMLLSLCACGKESKQTYNDAGYYNIFSLDTGDNTLTQAELSALGNSIFLQLDEGGAGILDLGDGNPAILSWHDGVIKDGSAEYSYVLAGGMLTLDMSDSSGTFVAVFRKGDPADARPNPSADSAFQPAEEKKDEISSADIVGTYRLTGMAGGDEGESLNDSALAVMESLGLTVRLYIEPDGTGELNMYGEAMKLTWDDKNITFEDEPAGYTLENGKLTITVEGEEFLTFEKISDEVDRSASSEPAEPEAAPSAPIASVTGIFDPVAGDLGDYRVEILSAEPFLDSSGEQAIRFYYDFTNNSDELIYASLALDFSASEDGSELDTTYASFEDDVAEYGNDDLYITPGVTIRCIAEYSYRPDGKQLVFTVSDYDDRELTAVFDPAALPGRPGEWTPEKIDDPQHFTDFADEGSNEYTRVYIDTAQRVEGDDWFTDGEVIRVFFDYTNLEDEVSYFRSETTVKAFQDGIELHSGYPEEEEDTDEKDYSDVDPGDSLRVSLCWELRTDSPVEIVVSDWWEDEILCAATFYRNS